MRHYILTRAVYGPAWALEDNRRRLELFAAVTVASLAAQTRTDWTWIVALCEEDPLLEARLELLEELPDARAVLTRAEGDSKQRNAARAYRSAWSSAMDDPEGPTLTTRIDDDDAFTADAMQRLRDAIAAVDERRVWMFPQGILVSRRRYEPTVHPANAWSTLAAPAGDGGLVYDFGHKRVREFVPVSDVDIAPAWLWVRHPGTISRDRETTQALTDEIREMFPIDWKVLERAWRS